MVRGNERKKMRNLEVYNVEGTWTIVDQKGNVVDSFRSKGSATNALYDLKKLNLDFGLKLVYNPENAGKISLPILLPKKSSNSKNVTTE